jgi:hypothetical protein
MASLIVLLAPVLGCLRLFFMPERDDADKDRIRGTAILFTGISLLSALWMWMTYDTGGERFQFVTDVDWVPSLGIGFRIGADGVSIAMVVLTSIVIWTGCYISRSITDRVKEHYILLLALVTGVFGVFLSLDLFFFYFFYEMAVIPMYLLIGVWGSRAQQYSKEYATMKLTLYLTAGAVVALVGLLAIYFIGARSLWDQGLLAEGSYTFDIRLLIQAKIASGLVPGHLPRLRLHRADVAAALLVADRPRGGAVGGLHAARGRAHETGRLRHPAHRLRHPPRGGAVLDGLGRGPLLHEHPVRRLRGDGAARHEVHHRLQLVEPHGLRAARARHARGHGRERRRLPDVRHARGHGRERRRLPDVRPRPHDGPRLRPDRLVLRPDPHARRR